MANEKIKVGDKVRIKSAEHFCQTQPYTFVTQNNKYFGNEALVINVTSPSLGFFLLDIDGGHQCWSSLDLEIIKPNESVNWAFEVWKYVLINNDVEFLELFNQFVDSEQMEYLHVYHLTEIDSYLKSLNLSPSNIIKFTQCGKIDWADDFFTDIVQLETFSICELYKHINFSLLFHEGISFWENIIGDEYSSALAEEIGLDFDKYAPYGRRWWKDFIQDKYDYVNIPDDVNQIRKDWEIWYNRGISNVC